MAADNKTLGRFILDGIPPAPRGVPQIEVTFDVDANGILGVTAKDKSSGKTQSIRIEASSGLTDEDIKRMQKEAETHSEEDRKKKELVDIKNNAEMLSYTAEKAIKDNEAKIPDDIKKSVREKIETLRLAKDGIDEAAIKKASEELSREMQKIGEAMSKGGETKPAEEGNVRDASYEEKKGDDTDKK